MYFDPLIINTVLGITHVGFGPLLCMYDYLFIIKMCVVVRMLME